MAGKKMMVFVVAVVFALGIVAQASFAMCGSCGEKKSCPDSQMKACADHERKMAKNSADKPKGDPLRKLGRGIANCVTFPIELPNQICKVNNNDGPVAAMTYGVVKGTVMSIFRAVIGGYETLTFLIPLPNWYRPILTDPEFMFEDWDV